MCLVMCWSKRDCVLTAAQRKSDLLQDRIDALEREKEDVEQSLEEAVVQVLCQKHTYLEKSLSCLNNIFMEEFDQICVYMLMLCLFLQAETAKAELEEERRKVLFILSCVVDTEVFYVHHVLFFLHSFLKLSCFLSSTLITLRWRRRKRSSVRNYQSSLPCWKTCDLRKNAWRGSWRQKTKRSRS